VAGGQAAQPTLNLEYVPAGHAEQEEAEVEAVGLEVPEGHGEHEEREVEDSSGLNDAGGHSVHVGDAAIAYVPGVHEEQKVGEMAPRVGEALPDEHSLQVEALVAAVDEL